MISKVIDCDVVVLGAGGSGLVAGVKAFDLTGKKVVILEKSKKPAGCTYFASGMGEAGPIRDSKWQKDAGYEVNEEPQDISGQFFDWLVTATKGDAEKYFYVSKPGDNIGMARGGGHIVYPDRYGKYKDLPDHTIGPGRMGSWVVDHLTARCKKLGIQILTETRARKFLTDKRGRMSGVIADTGDGQVVVNCMACIVAAGGYGANMDLLRKYYPKQFNGKKIHRLCPPAMTGDCILAAEEIGAYIDPTIRGIDFPGGFFGDGFMRHPWHTSLLSLTIGKCVIVNMDGIRWKNEAGMGGEGGSDGYIGDQRDGVAAAIVDSSIVEEVASQRGGMGRMLMMGNASRDVKEDLELEAAMDEAGASGNHTKKADTLMELALKMKVDPGALVETIERYNGFCKTGKDPDFGKPAQMLQPIKNPPFYAVFGNRWSQSTKGRNGIAVNSRFEALNTKGEVIPGLYAVGDGCTVFGGLVMGTPRGGSVPLTEEEEAARTKLSKEVAEALSFRPGAYGQVAPQSGMLPGGGMPGGPGGLDGTGRPIMGDGAQKTEILEDKGSPCGGLGPAFLSGYCAGTFAAKYLKEL